MRRSIALASLIVLLAVPLAAAAASEEKAPETVTLQGEVLDMACYISHGAKGADHAGCAKKCVKGGQPMGLLASDGTVYILYASHKDGSAFEKAKDFAGQKVEITGSEADQGGMHGIEVHSVKSI